MSRIELGKLWPDVIRHNGEFPNISEGAIRKLALIVLPPPDVRSIDPTVTTRNLRRFLAPHLQKAEIRYSLCDWIVKTWGGIASHDEGRFRKIVAQFGEFTISDCWMAVDRIEKFDRISSWSKLLSFAQPSLFAVFDARLAASLNILHAANGVESRYFIPATQNRLVARNRIRLMGPGPYLTYRDYINTLKDAAESLSIELQDVEMTLFAKSIAICESAADLR
jgi:hypothetical protein